MDKNKFETEVFNEIMKILARKTVDVTDFGDGFIVSEKGKEIFRITVIGLYSALTIDGNFHTLGTKMISEIYKKCAQICGQNKDSQKRPTYKKDAEMERLEKSIFGLSMDLLNQNDVKVGAASEGFHVVKNREIKFSVIVVDLYTAMNIKGEFVDLDPDYIAQIHSKCYDIYMKGDKILDSSTKAKIMNRAQENSVMFLRRANLNIR